MLADASVVAPWVIATVNWSPLTTRPTMLFASVMCGFAAFVSVQLITSPAAGVIVNDWPAPVGSVVPVPGVELVQEIDDA